MTAVAATAAATQSSSPQSSSPQASPSTPSASTRKSASAAALRWRTPMLFLAPFLLLFLGMYVLPIAFAIAQSLFTLKRDGLGLTAPTLNFDPLANYARVFADTEFTASLGRVLLFGVVQVPLMLGVALLLALLIDSKSARAKGFFRLSSFLPFAVPGVVAAVMWSFLYSPVTSPINGFLQDSFGFSIPFFSDGLALWSVANVVTWCWTGYNMLIIYSALQTIPAETLEAAKLDGASAVRMAWSIKIPMVRPAIILTTVFSIIGSAQLFNEPTVLKSISGGAITSTFTPLMAAQASVAAQNYPYAAAQSVVLAVLVGVLSWAFFRITSQGDDA